MTSAPTQPTGQVEPQGLLLQLLDPAFRADPYPLFARFREHGSFHLPVGNLAVFSSYRDCDEALRHPSSSNDRLKSTAARRQIEAQTQELIAAGAEVPAQIPPGFLFLDPPDHTRLRKLVSKAFAPKVVNALQPEITTLVHGLIERIAEKGRFEVVEDFAYPLPVAVICRLLGVPLEDEPQFSRVSALLAQSLDPFVAFTGTPSDNLKERMDAGMWLRAYLHGLIERRRSSPGDDLMSGLVAVEESGDQLSEEEIVSTCVLLLVAGHETTVNLIGTSTLALLRNPAEAQKLREDPSLMPTAIEEFLRYDGTVKWMTRMALEDIEIGEARIEAGDLVVLLVGAANRDPTQFRNPDQLDVTRTEGRQLGFGHGVHVCEGAQLARMEMDIAMTTLLRRMPDLRLAVPVEALEWHSGSHLRSLKALPVTF
jgi:cytochrome P450